MNLASAETIVRAVLYEGYILYPYRASAIKNRQRWTFGGLYPEAYARSADTGDACRMQTQCLLRGGPETRLELRLRFLHLVNRQVGQLALPLLELPEDGEPAFSEVEALEVDGAQHLTWQEAIEREVELGIPAIGALLDAPERLAFSFPGARELTALRASDGRIAGVLLRTSMTVAGEVCVSAERISDDVFRIGVGIVNTTPLAAAGELPRQDAQLYALASTHTILGTDAAFVSLLDPPEALAAAAAACANQGTWPVLVGAPGACDTLLSSPIILYDHPQVAPESPGDLYDATEIDEILSLRILAMADAEKREMAAVDARARALLERTEALTPEQWQAMHGTLRSPAPVDPRIDERMTHDGPRLACVRNGDLELRVGDRVRLHPKGGADIMDLVLAGKTAVIEAIELDFEDRLHVAVAVDDDPGREFGLGTHAGPPLLLRARGDRDPRSRRHRFMSALLIACVGNIFKGDDAFGVEVARRLAGRQLPPDVDLVDFGIRGIDLTYALLDRYDAAVLVDATRQGGAPGTLYVIEPEPGEAAEGELALTPHDLDPTKVLRMVSAMNGRCRRIVLVGCEPETFGDELEGKMGLSEPVTAAVDEAVYVIEGVVADLLSPAGSPVALRPEASGNFAGGTT